MVLCFCMIINGYYTFSVPYIYFEPSFICKSGTAKYPCSQTEACKNPEGYIVMIERSSIVTEHELYCDRRKYKSIAISLMNLLGGFLSLIFTTASDHHGRLIILKIGIVMALVASGLLMFVKSYLLNTILNIFLWLFLDVLISMIYVYFSEISSGQLRQKSNAVFVLFFTTGCIMVHLINIAIKDFHVIYIIAFGMSLLCAPFFFFLKRSPYFLFKKNRLEEFKKLLIGIWYVNQRESVSSDEEEKVRQRLDSETEKLVQFESNNQVRNIFIFKNKDNIYFL